jgi:diadenosine tetraphosphate (Ap4A) HIT family hydrolase
MSSWQLDPRLAADTELLALRGDVEIRAMITPPWPWLVLVPRVPGAVELFDLAPAIRAQLLELAVCLGARLKAQFNADKINMGALGNVVAQLHVHIVARHAGDPAWPGPVWGRAADPLDASAIAQRRLALRACVDGID